jgi:hypothetical protein
VLVGTGRLLLATVNYGATQGQCYAQLSTPTLANRQVVLGDLLGEVRMEVRAADWNQLLAEGGMCGA